MYAQSTYRRVSRFPYLFFLNRETTLTGFLETFSWCEDQFGRGERCWTEHVPHGTRWIYSREIGFGFTREDDACAFRMRWC